MSQNQKSAESALEIDRLATQLAKDPQSKSFIPLAEEYGKAGMWQEAAGVLEDGLKYYPGFITAMVALGRAYDQLGQPTKAKAVLEESIKLSPDNLRAHRTLIKIYTSQGEHDSALQSCAAILSVNPKDEEALSIQSSLGGSSKHIYEQTGPSTPHEAPISTTRNDPSPGATEMTNAQTSATSIPPPPHAKVVTQLEAWLRTIESRRHTRTVAHKVHVKTS
ncbi:MAG: tetratricopeptide repeat protein [Nitrospira sp.]|nr:tetratricopeptide repeat protein [Nitrospira sp.]